MSLFQPFQKALLMEFMITWCLEECFSFNPIWLPLRLIVGLIVKGHLRVHSHHAYCTVLLLYFIESNLRTSPPKFWWPRIFFQLIQQILIRNIASIRLVRLIFEIILVFVEVGTCKEPFTHTFWDKETWSRALSPKDPELQNYQSKCQKTKIWIWSLIQNVSTIKVNHRR